MYAMICDFCDEKIEVEEAALTLAVPQRLVPGADQDDDDSGVVEFHFCTWRCAADSTSWVANGGDNTVVQSNVQNIPEMPPEMLKMWEAAEAQVDEEERPATRIRIKAQPEAGGGTFQIGTSPGSQPNDDIPFGGVKRR